MYNYGHTCNKSQYYHTGITRPQRKTVIEEHRSVKESWRKKIHPLDYGWHFSSTAREK